MKRNLLLFFVFSLVANFAFAQFSMDPNEIIIEANDVKTVVKELKITNESDEEKEIHWKLDKAADFPADWVFIVCDANLCYPPDKDTNASSAPNVFKPGQTLKFKVEVRRSDFSVMNGSSHLILHLFDDVDKTNEVFVSGSPTSTTEVNLSDMVIFPNPTTDAFQIKNDANVSSVVIYNIVGRQIARMSHSEGEVHDVSDFRSGMYLVRLENKNGQVVKSMRLSKR